MDGRRLKGAEKERDQAKSPQGIEERLQRRGENWSATGKILKKKNSWQGFYVKQTQWIMETADLTICVKGLPLK